MHAPATPPRRRRSLWRTTRRVVLVGGGATVGLALGWLAWPRTGGPGPALGRGEHLINAWLKVGVDGVVTVVVPQAELGQGTQSALAQIVADEMGADWRSVRTEPAPLNPVYANKAMTNASADGLPPMVRDVARWAGAKIVERLNVVLTGGSTSIKAYEGPMRMAGATARAMLMKAAARGWDVDWTECDTRDGFVTHGARRVRFAELAAKAADETAPSRPALRPIAALGRSAPRLDIPAKTDGSAKFGADVRLPGMVYAAVRHGPVGTVAPPSRVGTVPSGAIAVTGGNGWVAVTADTWWGAKTALDTLDVAFPTASVPADSAAIERALAASLAVSPPLEGEGRLIEARYTVPFLAHACLETMTATARVADGRAEVWAPTQSTRIASYAVARALGIDETAVTIHPTLVGGGFGRKVENDAVVQAVLIARDTRRPVQLLWSREEDFGADRYRPAVHAHLSARLRSDGTIAAWRTRIAGPSLSQSFAPRNIPDLPSRDGPDLTMLEGARPDEIPYAIGVCTAEHVPIATPVPLGYWRSVGHSYTGFVVESFVDELAKAAGRDPLAFRLALLRDRPRHVAVLAAAAEQAGYTPGMGVALHESFGSIVAQIIELAPGSELRVARVTVAIDCGRAINPDSVRAQMEGSVVFGLGAALRERISFAAGEAVERNFDGFPLLTLAETPAIDIVILTNPAYAIGGVGEPGVPPVAAALANALAARDGRRVRDLPILQAA